MPIGGHPPDLDRAFGLILCPACRAGDHAGCRPLIQHARRRLLFCECPGWGTRGLDLILLPCLEEPR